MKVALKQINGVWDLGWVLDKHTLKSTYLGDDQFGHPQFDTIRTEVGEAAFQLKYRRDWSQCRLLAQTLADQIYPKLDSVSFVVPMPASKSRARQPVTELALEFGKLVGLPVFCNMLLKAPNSKSLKDLNSREERIQAIQGRLSLNDEIKNDGKWNMLLIDDLFDTGASMEAASRALRTYQKVNKIYVAALTWK